MVVSNDREPLEFTVKHFFSRDRISNRRDPLKTSYHRDIRIHRAWNVQPQTKPQKQHGTRNTEQRSFNQCTSDGTNFTITFSFSLSSSL